MPKIPYESKRLRKGRKTLDHTHAAKEKICLSAKEKLLLFKGLDRLGEENIQGLIEEYLPNRSESEIKSQIRVWKQYALEELDRKIATEERIRPSSTKVMVTRLDQWMEYLMDETEMSCPSQFALSNSFLLIAEYGKFPPPSECEGVDFRALYRALHCMMNGTPYYGLSQESAKLLDQSIGKLLMQVGKHSYSKQFESHLVNGTPRKCAAKNYSRPLFRGKLVVPTTSEAVLQMPGMNPLNLPIEALKGVKSSVEESESEESSSEEDDFSEDE